MDEHLPGAGAFRGDPHREVLLRGERGENLLEDALLGILESPDFAELKEFQSIFRCLQGGLWEALKCTL